MEVTLSMTQPVKHFSAFIFFYPESVILNTCKTGMQSSNWLINQHCQSTLTTIRNVTFSNCRLSIDYLQENCRFPYFNNRPDHVHLGTNRLGVDRAILSIVLKWFDSRVIALMRYVRFVSWRREKTTPDSSTLHYKRNQKSLSPSLKYLVDYHYRVRVRISAERIRERINSIRQIVDVKWEKGGITVISLSCFVW